MSDLISILQKPITVEKTSSISHVISELLKNKISRLIVTDNGTSAGIITEKDIGLFLLEDDSENNLDEIPVSQIMKILTSVNESMNVEKCVEIMLEKKLVLLELPQIVKVSLELLLKLTLRNIISKNMQKNTQLEM